MESVDLRKTEETIRDQKMQIRKSKFKIKTFSYRVVDVVVEKNKTAADLKSAMDKISKSERALAASNAVMKKLKAENGAHEHMLKKESDMLRKSREKEVALAKQHVEAEMRAKSKAHFKKLRKYMTNHEVIHQQMLFLSQAHATRKCLDKLIANGLDVPKEVMDKLFWNEAKYDKEIKPMEIEDIWDNDLVLSDLSVNPVAEDSAQPNADVDRWVNSSTEELQEELWPKIQLSKSRTSKVWISPMERISTIGIIF